MGWAQQASLSLLVKRDGWNSRFQLVSLFWPGLSSLSIW